MTRTYTKAVEAVLTEAKVAIRNGEDSRTVAEEIVAGLDKRMLTRLAVEFIVRGSVDRDREDARAAEVAASRSRFLAETVSGGGQVRVAESMSEQEVEARARKMAEIDAQYAAAREESDRRMYSSAQGAIEKFKAELRMEWTAELLDSTFALSNGERVKWGAATIDDHRDRLAMFTANAKANMQGAARHSAAIDELEASGAPCLNDLTAVAA